MITVQIPNVKEFMQKLLLTPTFDDWGFQGADVYALTQYSISGTLNGKYLTEEERSSRERTEIKYKEIRSILTSIVRGGRTPSQMKIVLVCPSSLLGDHVSAFAESYLMNIYFKEGVLMAAGAISMKTFTMDRSDAVFWDNHFPKVLTQLGIEHKA